jgi:hypothetical protein
VNEEKKLRYNVTGSGYVGGGRRSGVVDTMIVFNEPELAQYDDVRSPDVDDKKGTTADCSCTQMIIVSLYVSSRMCNATRPKSESLE